MSFWNEERVKRLKELWAEGYSASQIAVRLGGVTRGSVLGKLHRLGLSGKKRRPKFGLLVGRPRKKRDDAPAKRKSKPFQFGSPSNFSPVPKLPKEPLPQVAEEVFVPVDERKSLDQLTDNNCRWPIGDPLEPDFHWCNRTKVPGLPYCEAHSRRAFMPPTPKRRGSESKAKSKELVESK